MPRNVSGTYSLPLPPVVPNTVIQAAWANTTTDDIAQGITDSLDRNGRGGMIAPFRLVDGSVLQPAFAFSSETGTGLYRVSAGIMGVTVMGVQVAQWSGTAYSLFTDLGVGGNLNVVGDVGITGDLAFTGGLLVTGNVSVNGDLGITGVLQAGGGVVSFDDISVTENFNGSAGFFVTNISAGTGAYSVFSAVNDTSDQAQFGMTSSVYSGLAFIGTRAAFLSGSNAGGIAIIAPHASGSIRFAAGGATEQLRLTAAGQIGQGTNAPEYTFHQKSTAPAVVLTSLFPGVGGTPANVNFLGGAINSFGGSPVAAAGMQIGFTRIAGDTDYGSTILFYTAADNTSLERMRIRLDGGVAIGSQGFAGVGLSVRVGTNQIFGVLTQASNTTISAFTDAGASTTLRMIANPVIFGGDGSSNHAILNSSGNWGMGTLTPDVKLQVSSPSSGVAGIHTDTAGAPNQGIVTIGNALQLRGGDDYVGLQIFRSTTPLAHFDATGKLGVGMVSPTYPLDVTSSGSAVIRLNHTSGAQAYMQANGNTDVRMGSVTNHDLMITANGAPRLYVPTGNGGIYMRVAAASTNYLIGTDAGTDSSGGGAAIPIGAIICGIASGVTWGGLAALDQITLDASNTVTLQGWTTAPVLSVGVYRLISRLGVTSNVQVIRIG
jgi:hypothetical protein